MSPVTQAPAPDMSRVARIALVTGVAGLAACALGGALAPDQFFRSYLTGWLFWAGLGTGCLGVLMLQHLSGGAWGIVIRRVLEAAVGTIPLMSLLFAPLLFGLGRIYPWARPEVVELDELLRHKSLYLNVPFFIGRAVVCFAAWSALAWVLTRLSERQDATRDPALTRRLGQVSAGGILVYVLTMTFASVDWVMSLEPHWFSTIFGMLLVAGQALAALAFAIAVLYRLSERPPMSEAVGPAHFHDLGKLLLAFVMVWTYFAFSQFLIIWAGNLPEEIPYYLARTSGGWEWVGLLLAIAQFAAPFGMLLSRGLKRDAATLSKVAGLIVLMQLVNIFWMTAPAFNPGRIAIHWLDAAAPIGVGGLWVWAFARSLQRRPLLPLGDPYLADAMSHGRE